MSALEVIGTIIVVAVLFSAIATLAGWFIGRWMYLQGKNDMTTKEFDEWKARKNL